MKMENQEYIIKRLDKIDRQIKHLIEIIEPKNTTNDYANIQEVKDITTMGKSSIYYSINNNDFPKPVKIGRRSLWKRTELLKWLDECEKGLHSIATGKHLNKDRPLY